MRKLTVEAMEKEPCRGHGNSSKIFREVLAIDIGEILLIELQDWGSRKYSSSSIVRYIEKRYERKYELLHHALNKGWAEKRIK